MADRNVSRHRAHRHHPRLTVAVLVAGCAAWLVLVDVVWEVIAR